MFDATTIAHELGLRPAGRAFIGRCPACDYQGFQVREVDGRPLFRCHAGGCSQRAVLDALCDCGLWGEVPRPAAQRSFTRDSWHRSDPLDLVAKLWKLTRPASATAVEVYLRTRRFDAAIPADLRYLPEARHSETGSIWPAMVAAVRRAGNDQPVGLHRTFLRPDGSGKAPVAPAKKSLGPVASGAVRLAPASSELALSEGIETGLAVLLAIGVPTWAALSTGGLRKVSLPPLPLAATVTICADHDPAGIDAASAAAERLTAEGRRVRIIMPPEPGTDFSDLLADRRS